MTAHDVPPQMHSGTLNGDEGGPWGVYEERCPLCTMRLMVVRHEETPRHPDGYWCAEHRRAAEQAKLDAQAWP